MVEEKYGFREIRSRYPTAFAIWVQENSTGLVSPEEKIGIMFAGEIGVGGPISFNFRHARGLRLESHFFPIRQVDGFPFRVISPVPFFSKISCWSALGSLCTMAALSGASEAVAPATVTCDFDPCT